MGLFSCLPCCSTPLVPEDHTELSRDEVGQGRAVAVAVGLTLKHLIVTQLKRLYDRSIALNNGRLVVHGKGGLSLPRARRVFVPTADAWYFVCRYLCSCEHPQQQQARVP
jgi:hypothetical protein